MFSKIHYTCWACHRRSWYSVNNGCVVFFDKFIRGRRVSFIGLKCPKCFAEGSIRDKNPIPFLFVHKIKVASRQQFFAVLSSQLRLSDVGFFVKPPTINLTSPRRHDNRNIIKPLL